LSRPEKEPKTEIAKRFRLIREITGGETREQFAQRLNLPVTTLANYEKGVTEPPASVIAKYKDAFNIASDWLITGEGDMLIPETPNMAESQHLKPINQQSIKQYPEIIALPVYDIEASAGFGITVPEYEGTENSVLFTRQFLRHIRATPEACLIIYAKGDSMMPTITDGNEIIVDTSQKQLLNDSISVVNVAGNLLVKRIRYRINGDIDLVSDNKDYPVETIKPENADQVNIIGQAVFWYRAH